MTSILKDFIFIFRLMFLKILFNQSFISNKISSPDISDREHLRFLSRIYSEVSANGVEHARARAAFASPVCTKDVLLSAEIT